MAFCNMERASATVDRGWSCRRIMAASLRARVSPKGGGSPKYYLRLKPVADADHGGEQVHQPAGRGARGGDDHLAGEWGDVVAKVGADDQVVLEAVGYAGSHSHEQPPLIVAGKRGDAGSGLRGWRRPGGAVELGAHAGGDEGAQAPLPVLEVEQGFVRERMRLTLHVAASAAERDEGVAVVIHVADL